MRRVLLFVGLIFLAACAALKPVPALEPADSSQSINQRPTPEDDPDYNPADFLPATAPPEITTVPNTTTVTNQRVADDLITANSGALAIDYTAALTGLWANTADSKEVVEFTANYYSTFYEGALLLREPMTIHQRCPGACNDGKVMDIPCFTVLGPAGTDCFAILRLSASEMDLQLIGVSPDMVTYRRL